MRRGHDFFRSLLPALTLSLLVARAQAHAPLPRALAMSPEGGAVVLALPGFGLLVRPSADSRFAYACDALLGVPPSDNPALLSFFRDGSLLLGSPGGLRLMAADGCPRSEQHAVLGGAPIVALAIQPSTQVAYALATEHGDGVWRSSDQGVTWERRGSLDQLTQVTSLVLDPVDPAKLYVTRTEVDASVTLLVSSDAGASFTPYVSARALRLLTAQAAPARLWAVARALDSKGNRGFDVMYAPSEMGPWTQALRVNYFGGLTITPAGEIWIGDEGGGIYRSTDDGATFTNLDAHNTVACLASDTTSLLACIPALPSSPALKALDASGLAFEPVVAFADVDELVSCPAANNVAQVCQAAWIEWRRDVLMQNLTAGDAGVSATPDAGLTPAVPDAGTPPPPPAAETPAAAGTAAPAPSPQPEQSGCAVTPGVRGPATQWELALVALAWVMRRLRRSRP